jgi:hypothetical protein
MYEFYYHPDVHGAPQPLRPGGEDRGRDSRVQDHGQGEGGAGHLKRPEEMT